MRNLPIGPKERDDIDAQVMKVLRGLGNPEPPLDLAQVRELLRLDRRFYTSTDTGALREFVSRLTVGARRVVVRPTLLLDAVMKASLRALWIPEQKQILIDAALPEMKKRWAEGHEIVHSITPWHRLWLLGDDEETLRLECYEQLEHEANYGAGRLLFFADRFVEEASSQKPTIASVRALSKTFGNSLTTTLWRLVEQGHPGRALFGVLCAHPFRPDVANGSAGRTYLIESPAFRAKFSTFTEVEALALIRSYCSAARGGPLGAGTVGIRDTNGALHRFHMESFFNRHEVLTLGVDQGRAPLVVGPAT